MRYLPTETLTLDLNSWGWLVVLALCTSAGTVLLVAIAQWYWKYPSDSDEEVHSLTRTHCKTCETNGPELSTMRADALEFHRTCHSLWRKIQALGSKEADPEDPT